MVCWKWEKILFHKSITEEKKDDTFQNDLIQTTDPIKPEKIQARKSYT